MNLILQVVIVIIVAWLIFAFLIPMLAAPFGMILTIVVVIALIVWLLKVSGLWFN